MRSIVPDLGLSGKEICQRWRGRRRVLEKFQCRVDHRVLALLIIWRVEWVTVLEWNKKRAWRAHALGHFSKELYYHGRNALALQFGCDQTHGLVAHRSDRHQQSHVHHVFDEQLRGCRRGLCKSPPR